MRARVSPPACVCAGTARVLCVVYNNDTNGRNIDTRTCINRYIHTCIYPYHADGARRRCRAAHGSAGGRRTGVRQHGTKGFSNMGTHGVLPAYCAGQHIGPGVFHGGSGAAVPQQRSAPRQCAGVGAAPRSYWAIPVWIHRAITGVLTGLLTWVLTWVLTWLLTWVPAWVVEAARGYLLLLCRRGSMALRTGR